MSDVNKLIIGAITGKSVDHRAPVKGVTLDSAKNRAEEPMEDEDEGEMFDAAADFAHKQIAVEAATAVRTWIATEEDDLDSGETMSDRLFGLLLAVVDEDKNGKLDEQESNLFDLAREYAGDYLESLGADASDIETLVNDWDDDACEAVLSAVKSDESDNVLDSVLTFDAKTSKFTRKNAQYKPVKVVREGKIKFVNKRVGGVVLVSGKQKTALKKGRKLAWSAARKAKLAKSMKLSWASGLHATRVVANHKGD